MAFITAATLKTELAARLQQSESDLPADWTTVLARANSFAYSEILRKLRARGYTKAQVDSWADGAEYQVDLGIWHALIHGAAITGKISEKYTDHWLAQLDRRKELETVTLLDSSGNLLTADGGTVGHGRLRTTDDLFVLDRDDARIGTPTEW